MTSQTKQSLNNTFYYPFEFQRLELFKTWSKDKLVQHMKSQGHRMHSNITKPELIFQLIKNYRGGWNKTLKKWSN